MKRVLSLSTLLLSVLVAYVAGRWNSERPVAASAAGSRSILYYHDPMHPAYRSDKPGIAPDCGMQLEPVYADGEEKSRNPNQAGSLPASILHLKPERVQLMGIRVAAVEKQPIEYTLRSLGRVSVEETHVTRLSAADGWIEKVHPASTGTLVHKGDLLATFYSKEFQATQLAYLYALGSLDKLPKDKVGGGSAYDQIRTAEKELHALGMSDLQIAEITRTRKSVTDIDLRAPTTGFLLVRNATAGMRFSSETELYRIVDLDRVWIVAEMFENEARYFRPGLTATVSLPYEQRTLQARVIGILPELDPAAHTLQVRLEADNPGYLLRPDMFVDVEMPVSLPPTLTVPLEAVLDTGLRQTVFVDRQNGRFEPRRVETGRRLGNRVEIVSGLAENDRIVVSGNFFLDSESRIQAAALGLRESAAIDPACDMKIDLLNPGGRTSTYRGVTYYFCGQSCKEKFDKDPARYVAGDAGGYKAAPSGR